jgi:hypothetical protein
VRVKGSTPTTGDDTPGFDDPTPCRKPQRGRRLLVGALVSGVGVTCFVALVLLLIAYVLMDGEDLWLLIAATFAAVLVGTLAMAAGSAIADRDRTDSMWSWAKHRRVHLGLGAAATCATVVLLGAAYLRVDWGTPTRRVASPTGEFEVVQFEWTAVIDPAWNLAIERVEGGDREWFWRSVEGPAPETITFVGPTEIEVVDSSGAHYRVEFDPSSLEPSDRYCLRPEYCYSHPWDDYTRASP